MTQRTQKNDSQLFKNKYRVKSTRLKKWDYRCEGVYYITICTNNATQYFGQIKNDQMYLSKIGVIANNLVQKIPEHAPNASIDNYVIMPNHIHLLLSLTSARCKSRCRDVACYVSTDDTDDTDDIAKTLSSISPKSGSVSTIIRSFKSAVTRRANELGIPFYWQPRFHDHIVRDEPAYHQMWKYIDENPQRWDEDK